MSRYSQLNRPDGKDLILPKNAITTALITAVAVLSLVLSGCAPQTETESAPTSSESGGDPTGLNDDPELDDDTLSVLGKYAVDGDELVGDVPAEYAAVWDRFAAIIPADLRPEVTMFVAIDAEASGGTDGAMQANGLRPEERYIALDVTGSVDPKELDRTMIHEYAHLLTLRDSQVDPDPNSAGPCEVYVADSCPLDTSYLYAYLTEFWPDVHGPEFDESEDAIAERYNAEAFVTDYAAKNPDEDIAEVFAQWVIATTEPTGDRIVDEKLRFFDDYPELVQFRDMVALVL